MLRGSPGLRALGAAPTAPWHPEERHPIKAEPQRPGAMLRNASTYRIPPRLAHSSLKGLLGSQAMLPRSKLATRAPRWAHSPLPRGAAATAQHQPDGVLGFRPHVHLSNNDKGV